MLKLVRSKSRKEESKKASKKKDDATTPLPKGKKKRTRTGLLSKLMCFAPTSSGKLKKRSRAKSKRGKPEKESDENVTIENIEKENESI